MGLNTDADRESLAISWPWRINALNIVLQRGLEEKKENKTLKVAQIYFKFVLVTINSPMVRVQIGLLALYINTCLFLSQNLHNLSCFSMNTHLLPYFSEGSGDTARLHSDIIMT